jgi:YfiH family protein
MPIPRPRNRWREIAIGDDRALVRSKDGVTMIFGLGPPRGRAKEPDRLAAICDLLPVMGLRFCRQVHGRIIHDIPDGTVDVAEIGPGDGLTTAGTGTGLLVWTADCVPVLVAGETGVAAVHAGWRGCAADVAGAVVEVLCRRNHVTPDFLHAALGPSVCGACYEVGPEVVDALGRFGVDESRWLDGANIDLRGFLTARLEALGLSTDRIESVGGCTIESPELASHRRDGAAAGRQWSMIYRHHERDTLGNAATE